MIIYTRRSQFIENDGWAHAHIQDIVKKLQ